MSNPTASINTKQILFHITYDSVEKELKVEWAKPVLDRVIKGNHLFSVIVLLGQVMSELLHMERQIQIEKEKRKEPSKLFIPNA